MNNDNTNQDETQSIPPVSDPREVAARHQQRSGPAQPERIGSYKILEVLGEGGMGTVYLAEQTSPVHRRVALKIVKLGMDTKQVVARFEAEREALALMNHPGVAKVFDAGVSDEGRPYFVMEYVPGIPITDYCDKHRLSTNERLQLFIKVCTAVQHAHQKGIIHRDIKPGNVLVAVQDGAAVPKVIDFGVAKATQQRLTEHTLFTEQGQLIGTPGYMSPEQAEMTALDVDTRTDIYSLGVLLYELLVGARPFDDEALRKAGLAEIQRIIREVDPPKPSTRLSSLGDNSTQVARMRRTEVHALSRLLRDDLDWVVMKCLEKDRNRRYDTANGLAMEIQRYLSHQPVLAGPPTAAYRLRKFLRRNKGPVLAVAAIVLALAAGVVATGLMYRRAIVERDRAVEAERLTAQSLKEVDAAREDAEAVTKFLTDMLAAVDPEKQGKDVSVREVLDGAANRIREEFADRPLIQARLQYTVGWTYQGLGLFDEAQAHLADAAALYHRLKGQRHPDTLRATNALGVALAKRGNYSAAEARLITNLEISKRVLGEQHPDTLHSMNNLAVLFEKQGRYDEGELLLLKTLEIEKRVLGEEHADTLNSMHNLALLYLKQGRYAEAEPLYLKTIEIKNRVLDDEHPDTLASMVNLALLYKKQGRYTQAELLYLKTLEIMKRVLGEEHPNTLSVMGNLAILYKNQGRYTEAESLYLKTLEIKNRVLGEEHPDMLALMGNLANLYHVQGRYAEAEPLAAQAVAGADQGSTARTSSSCSASRYLRADPA